MAEELEDGSIDRVEVLIIPEGIVTEHGVSDSLFTSISGCFR